MPDPSIAEIEWRIETQRLAGSTRASVEITQLRTLIAAYKERDVLRAENERLFAAHNKLAQRIAALTGEKSDG